MAFILNLENPFQLLEPETERLFAMETEHMAAPGFFQNGNSNLRRAAQRAMRRLSETPGFVHDPLVPFLALNYYDRSISRERIPGGWFFGLFVISCTVLALKMRANGFSVAQLLGARPIRVGGVNMEVEVGHVERMEFQILSVLNWQTRSITPVCFTDFFMSLIGIDDLQERQTFKERVFENQILYMHRDIRFTHIRFTQFRPSIIAVVGIIAESEEDRLADFWDPVLGSEFVVLGQEYFALFTFGCTALAWKRRSNDFSVQLLLERNRLEGEQVVEAVESMELRILDALNRKADSITALCFIDFFLSLIRDDDPDQMQTIKHRKIVEHILFMHYDCEFTQFKPSIIAAVGVVAESTENGYFCDPILRCEFVDTDEFEKCLNLLKSKRIIGPRIDEAGKGKGKGKMQIDN